MPRRTASALFFDIKLFFALCKLKHICNFLGGSLVCERYANGEDHGNDNSGDYGVKAVCCGNNVGKDIFPDNYCSCAADDTCNGSLEGKSLPVK